MITAMASEPIFKGMTWADMVEARTDYGNLATVRGRDRIYIIASFPFK